MTGGQGGYWVVSTESHDAPTRVELVATFEQARTRFQALDAAQVLSVEVFGSDGAVLLHQNMERWEEMGRKAREKALELYDPRAGESFYNLITSKTK